MRFSTWHAHGNVYLLVERAELTPDEARALSDADGRGRARRSRRGEGWAEVVIWNPDGSTAELSGNGTRIARRWLAGADGRAGGRGPRRAARSSRARMLGGGLVEQDLGPVEVGAR